MPVKLRIKIENNATPFVRLFPATQFEVPIRIKAPGRCALSIADWPSDSSQQGSWDPDGSSSSRRG